MPCHHLESLAGRVTARLKLDAHVLSLPTAFLASFGSDRPGSKQRSVILRIDPEGMDLSRQFRLILIGRAVAAGSLSVELAVTRLLEIEREHGLDSWLKSRQAP